MKAKHILFSMATAALFAACTNDEFESTSVDYSNLPVVDASNFTLVSTATGEADTRLVTIPGYDDGTGKWQYPAPKWESGLGGDAIGFSLIYPSDNCLTTNYRFYIQGEGDIDSNGNATFRTDETTIFGGDYFVYYPYNEEFKGVAGDATIGIPFSLDAIQAQNTAEPIRANDKPNLTNPDEKFKNAVAHLNAFSISNRITGVQPGVQQSEFSLKRYTGTLNLRIYPVNQTHEIAVKRIEMVCDNENGIVVSGKFRAQKGVNEPQFTAEETTDKLVLTFNSLKEEANQNGLCIAADTKEAEAYMGYLSLCPGTYKNVTFYIYYTETGNMKRVEINKGDITVASNTNYRVGLPVNANGATELTSYDIYSESEFAAAVTKSNAMNAGDIEGDDMSAAVFTLKDDITLTQAYTLNAKVPVTFEGEKTITLARSEATKSAHGISLHITSGQPVVINNTIKGGDEQHYDIKVSKGNSNTNIPDVTIAAVQSPTLHLTCDNGTLTVLNAAAQGSVASLYNRANMVVENATVKGNVQSIIYNSTDDSPVISLKKVSIGGDLTNKNRSGSGKESTLEDVTVGGDFQNQSASVVNAKNVSVTGMLDNNAELNLEGTNSFGAGTTLVDVDNAGTINVGEEATVTLGNVTATGTMDIDGTVTAKGTTQMTGLMTLNGTYTAVGALTDLTQARLDLEGILNTQANVDLEGSLQICGVINNSGTWTLGSNEAISQRNHSHSTKDAEFNNSGVVTVEGITTTSLAAIQNMPKELYKKVDNGRLIWKGMENVADINNFVEMDGCWATDFNAVLNLTGNTNETLNSNGTWDWSKANVIIDLDCTGKTETISFAKALTIQNLTINLGTSGQIKTQGNLDGYELTVSNQFALTGGNTTFDADCDILTKDLYVEATEQGTGDNAKLVVLKAEENMKYSGQFTQVNGKNINFKDGSPQVTK